jgi:hypothetical protein
VSDAPSFNSHAREDKPLARELAAARGCRVWLDAVEL